MGNNKKIYIILAEDIMCNNDVITNIYLSEEKAEISTKNLNKELMFSTISYNYYRYVEIDSIDEIKENEYVYILSKICSDSEDNYYFAKRYLEPLKVFSNVSDCNKYLDNIEDKHSYDITCKQIDSLIIETYDTSEFFF